MVNKQSLLKKTRGRWLKIIIILCIFWISGNVLIKKEIPFSSFERAATVKNEHNNSANEEWNLLVVNRWNDIPEDYNITLTELSNGQSVDSRIYPYLQEMFDAARADGIYPIVREGYRTLEDQQKILNDKINAYINEGYSHAEAEQTAKEWVALPGHSEHELGIAVDINADKSKSNNDKVYVWLASNAYKYGFILRYIQGKENLTGTSYEPWHYRYVGKEVAEEIYNGHICLEEYLNIIHDN